MKKKLLACLIAVVMVFGLVAPALAETTTTTTETTQTTEDGTVITTTVTVTITTPDKKEEEPAEGAVLGTPLLGGWTIAEEAPSDVLPEDVQAAFDVAASELLGNKLVPVAYLGKQIVAGTNHAILCTSAPVIPDPETKLVVVILYVDLEGNAKITAINEFALTGSEEAEAAPDAQLAGGWTIPEAYSVVELPEEAAAAFAKASEGFLGNKLEPIAYLGNQVVAGMNYAVLCRSTLTTNPPVSSIQLVIVSVDTEGNATFGEIRTIHAADYTAVAEEPEAETAEPAAEEPEAETAEPAAEAPEAEAAEPAAEAPEAEAAESAAEEPEAETAEPAVEAPEAEAAEPAAEAPESEDANAAEPNGLLGGWTISENETAAALPEDVQNAFDAASKELLGNKLVPVAYLGSQVVAGTNNAILCKSTPVTLNPETKLVVVILYRDLEGNAKITHINDFALDAAEEAAAPAEQLAGGWAIPQEYAVITLPDDPAAAFAKAKEGFVGNSLEPIAYLGSQVVAGTNYAILCHSTLATNPPVSSIQLVIVTVDPEGNATFGNIRTLNIADYNPDAAAETEVPGTGA